MTRRWAPLVVATAMTALLAAFVGASANRVLTPRTLPAPQLKTVPASTLARMGLTLSGASQPPYCGLASAVAHRGWTLAGSAGCAVERETAEAAATSGSRARVVESVLALVTSTRPSSIGRSHPSWVVVTQTTIGGGCQQTAGGWSACVGVRSFTQGQLVLVDAYSGAVINSLSLTPMQGGRTRAYPPAPPIVRT